MNQSQNELYGSVRKGAYQTESKLSRGRNKNGSVATRSVSKYESKGNRSISSLSRGGQSVHSVGARGRNGDTKSRLSKDSRCGSNSNLSQMSRTSKKSVKLINASLERIHTFGMANIHKNIYDIEKIDGQYDPDGNKKKKKGSEKKILRTTSSTGLAKFKNK